MKTTLARMVRRYAIVGMLIAVFATVIVTLGSTLATIERRQHNEDAAIQCLLDSRCLIAIRARQMHMHRLGSKAARVLL
jgi:hypothetical protein